MSLREYKEYAGTKPASPNYKIKQIWGSGKSLLTYTDHHNMTRRNFNLLLGAEGRLLMGDTYKAESTQKLQTPSVCPGLRGSSWMIKNNIRSCLGELEQDGKMVSDKERGIVMYVFKKNELGGKDGSWKL